MRISQLYIDKDPHLKNLLRYIYLHPERIDFSTEEFTKSGKPWLRLRFEGRDCYVWEFARLTGLLLPCYKTTDRHGRTLYKPTKKITEYEVALSEEPNEPVKAHNMPTDYACVAVGPI